MPTLPPVLIPATCLYSSHKTVFQIRYSLIYSSTFVSSDVHKKWWWYVIYCDKNNICNAFCYTRLAPNSVTNFICFIFLKQPCICIEYYCAIFCKFNTLEMSDRKTFYISRRSTVLLNKAPKNSCTTASDIETLLQEISYYCRYKLPVRRHSKEISQALQHEKITRSNVRRTDPLLSPAPASEYLLYKLTSKKPYWPRQLN